MELINWDRVDSSCKRKYNSYSKKYVGTISSLEIFIMIILYRQSLGYVSTGIFTNN